MRKLYNTINREILIEKMRSSQEERITISFYKYCKILNPDFFEITYSKNWMIWAPWEEFIWHTKESMHRFLFQRKFKLV